MAHDHDERVYTSSVLRRYLGFLPFGIVFLCAGGGFLPIIGFKLYAISIGLNEPHDPLTTFLAWLGIGAAGCLVASLGVWFLYKALWYPHVRLGPEALSLPGGTRVPYDSIQRLGSSSWSNSETGAERYRWSMVLVVWETDDGEHERRRIPIENFTRPQDSPPLAEALDARTDCEIEPVAKHVGGLWYTFEGT